MFDDSTSSEDGDSEGGEGESDISDLDQELHGVVEPERQEDGHEILGKSFRFVLVLGGSSRRRLQILINSFWFLQAA